MNPQDFKALLESLDRISGAIEHKADGSAQKIVNSFSEVYRMIETTRNVVAELKYSSVIEEALTNIMKKYVEVSEEVLNENS